MYRKIALLAVVGLMGLVALAGCMMSTSIPLNVTIQMPGEAVVGVIVSFESIVGGCQQCSQAYYEYEWQFGDGAMSMAQNPTHTYGAAGTYSVALSVIARCSNGRTIGCGDATSTIVIVEPTPGPIPEPMPPCPTPCPPPCPPPCPVPPEPEPEPDICNIQPVLDVVVLPSSYPHGRTSFQVTAYQPGINSGGYHPEDFKRIKVVFESPSHKVTVFGAISAQGVIEIDLDEAGPWEVRGIGWNRCGRCPLTDEFSHYFTVT